jgi:hypothetical protein
MATTLIIGSFADTNLRERSALDAATAAATSTFTSTACWTGDQRTFVGTPGTEGCEAVVVLMTESATSETLTIGRMLVYTCCEPVPGAVCGSARIYFADYR